MEKPTKPHQSDSTIIEKAYETHKAKEIEDNYHLTKIIKTIVKYVFIVFTVVGVIIFVTYVFGYLVFDKIELKNFINSVYEPFWGALVAILMDRMIFKNLKG